MEKIFYTDKHLVLSSTEMVTRILDRYFNVKNAVIARTENGKPYLHSPTLSLHFSISHTNEKWFVAFCSENVGIDGEKSDRQVNIPLLLKRFTVEEREEIVDGREFLLHWTAKESAVKWLGETLSHTLRKLTFVKGRLRYEGLELPVEITHREIDGHILTICSERDFSSAELIRV